MLQFITPIFCFASQTTLRLASSETLAISHKIAYTHSPSSSSSAKESSDGFARRGAADGFRRFAGGGRRDPPASAMGAGRARGAVAATGAGSAASRARSDEQTASSGATICGAS